MYLNPANCVFNIEEVGFLGHIVGHKQVKMDHAKVSTINRWLIPRGVIELQSFLELANYYKKFI